jgi:hypothetical protein
VSQLTERFAEAVLTLVGDGPVKQRLIRAFGEHLGDLDGADLPPALRPGFSKLQAALSSRLPVGTESRVQASVQKMSPAEAGDYAVTIVELYAALVGQLDRSEPLRVITSNVAPVVSDDSSQTTASQTTPRLPRTAHNSGT